MPAAACVARTDLRRLMDTGLADLTDELHLPTVGTDSLEEADRKKKSRSAEAMHTHRLRNLID